MTFYICFPFVCLVIWMRVILKYRREIKKPPKRLATYKITVNLNRKIKFIPKINIFFFFSLPFSTLLHSHENSLNFSFFKKKKFVVERLSTEHNFSNSQIIHWKSSIRRAMKWHLQLSCDVDYLIEIFPFISIA